MSVISCNEVKGRSGELGVKNEFTAERTFQVETSLVSDDEVTVIDYILANVATIGSQHPSTAISFLKSISAQQSSDDGYQWSVSLSYGPFAEDEREENPLNKPAEIEYDFQVEQVPIDYDTNNQRIQNSVGDPPTEAIEIPIYRLVINVNRNEASVNAVALAAYAGAVNADIWQGFEAGSVQFIPGRVRREWDNNIGYYYIVSYSFTVNTDKYVPLRILDQGFREFNDDDEPVYILDADDEKLSDPALLDGAGHKLPTGNPPVFREYNHLKQLPFNALFNF